MGNYIPVSNPRSVAASPTPPSPEQCGITQLSDEVIPHHYIEFPEDTIFMESLAYNQQWNINNSSNFAYVPVQRFVNGGTESHIYTIEPHMEQAVHLLGPLAAVDDYGPTTDVTVFGSALSHDGILYVCAFNRNAILAYDLQNYVQPSSGFVPPLFEIPNVWAPNDISIDPDDPSVLYVAGGSLKRLYRNCHGQDTEQCLLYSNPVDGVIYKITLTDTTSSNNVKDATVTVLQKDLLTLAGIEVLDGLVWTAQLFNMFVVPTSSDSTTQPTIVWQGDDNSDTSKNILDDVVWLADNVDTADFGNRYLVSPAFSTQGEILVDVVLTSKFLATLGNFAAQIVTKVTQKENLPEALLDPEVDLCFSNTYIQEGVDPEPVRLIFLAAVDPIDFSTSTSTSSCESVHHFEIDLVETRRNHPPREVVDPRTKQVLGMRHFFNEQVTHTAHHYLQSDGLGYLALVNFEQPRILMLEDTVFRSVLP